MLIIFMAISPQSYLNRFSEVLIEKYDKVWKFRSEGALCNATEKYNIVILSTTQPYKIQVYVRCSDIDRGVREGVLFVRARRKRYLVHLLGQIKTRDKPSKAAPCLCAECRKRSV